MRLLLVVLTYVPHVTCPSRDRSAFMRHLLPSLHPCRPRSRLIHASAVFYAQAIMRSSVLLLALLAAAALSGARQLQCRPRAASTLPRPTTRIHAALKHPVSIQPPAPSLPPPYISTQLRTQHMPLPTTLRANRDAKH